jgi:hypothetical protein
MVARVLPGSMSRTSFCVTFTEALCVCAVHDLQHPPANPAAIRPQKALDVVAIDRRSPVVAEVVAKRRRAPKGAQARRPQKPSKPTL